MKPDEVREVVEHVASALAYLADRGAVHRDVKPANILRVGSVWKLGDFGLVRGFSGTSLQASGRKGTVLYMSPEAMQGETGPFVDVWALGVVIQECLTGMLPYSGGSDTEIIAAALTREPTISHNLVEPFASVVRSCLTRDRMARWPAAHVLEALRGEATRPAPRSVVVPAAVSRPDIEAAGGRRFTGSRPPADAHLGDVWVNPKDGAKLVYVPAGEFIMGSNDGPGDEKPQRRVYLDPYWIYKHEVTAAQYRRFCSETGRKMPNAPEWGGKDDHPIVRVTWDDAKAYADWAGVSLPTEAQWEKAARGTDGRKWPWGDMFEAAKCVCSVGTDRTSTAPVGSMPKGASPYGCLDMAENVWEWCADWFEAGLLRGYSQADSDRPFQWDSPCPSWRRVGQQPRCLLPRVVPH